MNTIHSYGPGPCPKFGYQGPVNLNAEEIGQLQIRGLNPNEITQEEIDVLRETGGVIRPGHEEEDANGKRSGKKIRIDA